MKAKQFSLRTYLFAVLAIVFAMTETGIAEETVGSEGTQTVFPVKDIPGSIIDQLDRAEQERDYLFQIPGLAGPMQSWNQWKAKLNEKYGLLFLLEWAALGQIASGTFGDLDNAAGYDAELNGTWTFLGKDTPTYSIPVGSEPGESPACPAARRQHRRDDRRWPAGRRGNPRAGHRCERTSPR